MVKAKAKPKTKAVVVKEKQAVVATVSTPAEMIKLGIANGSNLPELRELLSLQIEWEANEAKKAYNIAMTAFKADPPRIEKNKAASFPAKGSTVKYKFADLADAADKINGCLSQHGLSASWTTHQNGAISVTCKITHIKGHSEETTLTAGAETSGVKNSIQALGSTITYLERYTLFALTGIIPHGMDGDGHKSSEPKKSTVSMPSAKKTQQDEGFIEAQIKEGPGNDNIPEESEKSDTAQSGAISVASAKILKQLATMNGYTKEEMYEKIDVLGYKKLIHILKQDFDTIVSGFQVNAEIWRKNREEEINKTWEE